QLVRSQTQPELIMDTKNAERQESRVNERLDEVLGAEGKAESLSSHVLPDLLRYKNLISKGYKFDGETVHFQDPVEQHSGGRIIAM
ncbi:unnamed protein product, partial [Candidula unifasciata]